MGQHAEDILNGDVDQYTGEWISHGEGYPRSESTIRHKDGRITSQNHDPLHYKKGTKAIRKELAILIRTKKEEIPDITTKQENKLVDDCRKIINLKYGKGWREQY